jgi:nucleotide-binding universal stress UspA family protein
MKILMYYDGSGYSRDALPYVKKHAKAFDAQVVVVSSLTKGSEAHLKEIESLEDGLEYVKSELEREKIRSETHLLIKGHNAGDDIVQFANEHKVDEIVIGTEKKSRVEMLVLGSVAQYVATNAPCPVVII